MIPRVTKGPRETVDIINTVIDKVNTTYNIRGDGIISAFQASTGTVVGINVDALLPFIPIFRPGDNLTWAKVIQTVTPPNLAYPDTEQLHYGYYFYVLREIGTEYEAWVAWKQYTGIESIMDDEVVYTSILPSIGIQPGVTIGWENYWLIDPEIIIDRVIGTTEGNVAGYNDLRNFIPYYPIGEIIPIVEREGKKYINETFIFTGERTNASLGFHHIEHRAMALFR